MSEAHNSQLKIIKSATFLFISQEKHTSFNFLNFLNSLNFSHYGISTTKRVPPV